MLPDKIAIIAGQGSLPKEIYDACINNNIEAHVIGLDGQCDLELFKDIPLNTIPIHAVSNIINTIKAYGITNIVLAGRVKRAVIPKLMLDFKGAKLFARILSYGLSDKGLGRAIIKFLESEGFTVLSPEVIAKESTAVPGNMTKVMIHKRYLQDIAHGRKTLNAISQLDVGQSLIIQNGLILGVEAAEGTNDLIKRCGAIKQQFETDPVLIKICKPHQDRRIDLPCVGPITIETMHEFGIKGMALQPYLCLILDKKKTIELANKYDIFIYGLQ